MPDPIDLNLYLPYLGMVKPGNINLRNRPRFRNLDGSISTVRSISVNFDDLEYLIPTISDDGRIMSDQEAIELFKKTKRHLGAFDSIEGANSYAQLLHKQQERMLKLESSFGKDQEDLMSNIMRILGVE